MARRGRLVLSLAMTLAALLPAATAGALGETSMYSPDDPLKDVKQQIEDVYGVYILLPSRRNPQEKVEINGDTVTMWLYVDPRKPDYDKVKCDALKWTLLGRFGTGGAQPFFNQFEKYNNVNVFFFKLDSTRTVDKDGKYTVKKDPNTILKVQLSRRKSERLDWNAVKAAMPVENQRGADYPSCVRAGERFVDRTWYNKEYFK